MQILHWLMIHMIISDVAMKVLVGVLMIFHQCIVIGLMHF